MMWRNEDFTFNFSMSHVVQDDNTWSHMPLKDESQKWRARARWLYSWWEARHGVTLTVSPKQPNFESEFSSLQMRRYWRGVIKTEVEIFEGTWITGPSPSPRSQCKRHGLRPRAGPRRHARNQPTVHVRCMYGTQPSAFGRLHTSIDMTMWGRWARWLNPICCFVLFSRFPVSPQIFFLSLLASLKEWTLLLPLADCHQAWSLWTPSWQPWQLSILIWRNAMRSNWLTKCVLRL